MMKKLIAFDLDGTLAESKSPLDEQMTKLLLELLEKYEVAIISGGDFPQFQKNVIPFLTNKQLLSKLHLYPTCGTKAFVFETGEIKKLYSEDLSEYEIKKATKSINIALKKLKLYPDKIYGKQLENRGTQVTYSALGQDAPNQEKKSWDPNFEKRIKIKDIITPLIPELKVSIGGTTSIDITKKGIDKTFAIEKLKNYLNITDKQILFIGDALTPGGNDYPVKQMGIETIETSSIEETKEIIIKLINNK